MKNQFNHLHFLGLTLLSAVLLTISWQPFGLVLPVFFGLVPLLKIEHELRIQGKNAGWVFLYAYLGFFTWNICTTWWVWNASEAGAIMAFVLNSLLMCIPFMLYHWIGKRTEGKKARRILIFFWIAFEYMHYNWEGNYPWLTLGNVFSSSPMMVQWYEYTGALGGSIWVLYANNKFFDYLQSFNSLSTQFKFSRALNLVFFVLFAPIFLSWWIGDQYKNSGTECNVLVVQPNIDPYKDKFGNMSPVEQTRKMLVLAEKAVDSTTKLVCFPETAVVGNLNEADLSNNPSILMIKQFILAHPQLVVLTGADTYKFYPSPEMRSATARQYDENNWYDSYNTALLIDASDSIQFYHKSKLVPGVEKLPYANAFGWIKQLTIDLGGTSGSLGSDPDSKALVFGGNVNHPLMIAPVICYESIFGEYVGSYIQKGAGLIGVITNDGWWGNTPGYKQHFDYARLRAIESRRYVARSANTGISGFIDDKGNVLSKSEWWNEDAMSCRVKINSVETFYTRFGDYLGKASLWLSFLFIVLAISRKENVE